MGWERQGDLKVLKAKHFEQESGVKRDSSEDTIDVLMSPPGETASFLRHIVLGIQYLRLYVSMLKELNWCDLIV